MALTDEQEKILEKIIGNHPELKKEDINALLDQGDEIYIGGGGFFGKIDKEGKLINIISQNAKVEGNEADLFDILFEGNIYDIEESSEYNSLLTFGSNASGYLSVFFAPGINEFYVAPRIVKKAYKAAGDNKFTETKLPEFTEGDMEHFKWWSDRYKLLSENKKDKPSK